MRIFIAIPIPAPCRDALTRMQSHLQTGTKDVRWTPVASIHLTLKFLGETDSGIIPPMAESLRSASSRTNRFRLRLAGLGCFPHLKSPRVVWCGVEGDTDTLSSLQKTVETACTAFGFQPEDRPFRPHLTLGRVQSGRGLQALADRIASGSGLECSFGVDGFNIYKSVLKPQGAVYTVLETIALH